MQLYGNLIFILSGVLSISTSVIASILRDRYGFDYSLTGTLLAVFNLGTFVTGFAAGFLAAKMGLRKSSILLAPTYTIGFLLLSFFGAPAILMTGFFFIGAARGMVTNTCNVMVGESAVDKTKALNQLHACYAFGALLSPIVIISMTGFGDAWPTLVLAILGLPLIWLIATAGLSDKHQSKEETKGNLEFMKSPRFILLTILIFCQNGAETAVVSWVVTYYKDSGILSGDLATYTISVIWGATLIGRLIIAFVLKIKSPAKALLVMGIGTTLSYLFLMTTNTGPMAILGLFLFAFSLAGTNPTAVSCAGKELTPMSLAIMLPTASLGQIIMPWIIGITADRVNLYAGMGLNLIPCTIFVIAAALFVRVKAKEENA